MKMTLSRAMLLLAVCAGGCATTTTNSHPGVSNNISPPVDAPAKPDAPLTANTRFAAGQVAESQGDYPRAIAQYQSAANLDPTASVPLLRLGMIYTKQGQFNQAVAIWHRYITVTKDDAAGYADLGYTLELAQRQGDAENAYKNAIQRDAKNETARVDYGLMLARQGRITDASTQLSAVLTPAEVHYDLASVLESQGKKQAAKDEYQHALRLDPEMSDAQTRLASLE